MIRQAHLIAVVGTFLMGCSILLVVGCAGGRSEAPEEEQDRTEATRRQEQGRTEATREQAHSDRCDGTRAVKEAPPLVTNDVPGCPKGGLLYGSDGRDQLDGGNGNDEIHGLGDKDDLYGGYGADVIYGGAGDDIMQGNTWHAHDRDRARDILHGGPGRDDLTGDDGDDVLYGGDGDDNWLWGVKGIMRCVCGLSGGRGEDVLYGGDGDDVLDGGGDGDRDKLYCGEGKDLSVAEKIDYVDSSCEVKREPISSTKGFHSL